jgi:hypothetical protein
MWHNKTTKQQVDVARQGNKATTQGNTRHNKVAKQPLEATTKGNTRHNKVAK